MLCVGCWLVLSFFLYFSLHNFIISRRTHPIYSTIDVRWITVKDRSKWKITNRQIIANKFSSILKSERKNWVWCVRVQRLINELQYLHKILVWRRSSLRWSAKLYQAIFSVGMNLIDFFCLWHRYLIRNHTASSIL